MKTNERHLWLGDTLHPTDASLTIWRAHRNAYWLRLKTLMAGPYDKDTVRRAVAMACTPTIDGCENGPHRLGFAAFDNLQQRERGPGWQEVTLEELPPSTTLYAAAALEPIRGCCTVDEAIPVVDWSGAFEEQRWVGRLKNVWNAHPKGSLILSRHKTLEDRFSVVDG